MSDTSEFSDTEMVDSDVEMVDEFQNCVSDYESDSGSDIVVPVSKRLRVISDSSDGEDDFKITTQSNTQFVELSSKTSFTKQTQHAFVEVCGPKHTLEGDAAPLEYFNLFFTEFLYKKMVIETNRYALQFFESYPNLKPHSRMNYWTPCTIPEMEAFVAVILEMGITRRPTISSYWNKNSRHIPWFSNMFSRNRFQLLLRFFHLANNETLAPPGHPEYNPCARFDFLIEHANTVFRQHYVPNKQLTIRESLVGTKCQTTIKQYLPNKKRHKWGIKLWMLCDSITKYCLGFYCYCGPQYNEGKDEMKQVGLGSAVVEKLLSLGNYFNKGYHLFTDNFYTSTELARSLLEKGTYITGTIRRNRKLIPKEAKITKVGEPKYFSNGEILMCSYRDKQSIKNPVILVSTDSNIGNVTVKKKRGNYETEKIKPAMIHAYNQFIGGVDESEKMLYSYLDERRTVKFWKKIVFNIFGIMTLNSYIIYQHNSNNKKMTRLEFTSSVISALEKKWIGGKNKAESHTSSKPTFGLEKLPGRNLRRCVVCSSKNRSAVKRSNLICSMCKKGLHGICIGKHVCK